MTDWVRLWHDMPTDPKWRVIARKSGRSVSEVIAVFNFVMVNASANATERGRTHNLFAEDIAAALDMEEAEVEAIFAAMEGKVIAGGVLMGWDKRQPKREDNSALRAKEWREAKKAERNRTQENAEERPETETEVTPLDKSKGVDGDSDKAFWDGAKAYLGKSKSSLIGRWCSTYGQEETGKAITAAQIARAVDPIPYIERTLKGVKREAVFSGPC